MCDRSAFPAPDKTDQLWLMESIWHSALLADRLIGLGGQVAGRPSDGLTGWQRAS